MLTEAATFLFDDPVTKLLVVIIIRYLHHIRRDIREDITENRERTEQNEKRINRLEEILIGDPNNG